MLRGLPGNPTSSLPGGLASSLSPGPREKMARSSAMPGAETAVQPECPEPSGGCTCAVALSGFMLGRGTTSNDCSGQCVFHPGGPPPPPPSSAAENEGALTSLTLALSDSAKADAVEIFKGGSSWLLRYQKAEVLRTEHNA
ncbi:hypothetical protein STEG23_004226 [Scotinomys teguina]